MSGYWSYYGDYQEGEKVVIKFLEDKGYKYDSSVYEKNKILIDQWKNKNEYAYIREYGFYKNYFGNLCQNENYQNYFGNLKIDAQFNATSMDDVDEDVTIQEWSDISFHYAKIIKNHLIGSGVIPPLDDDKQKESPWYRPLLNLFGL